MASGFLSKTFKVLVGTGDAQISQPRKLTDRDLIQLESEIGRTLFGSIPSGHNREFFNLNATTWIWHESWSERGHRHDLTVRYEVHSKGVLKVLPGPRYVWIEGEELENLVAATELYYEKVMRQVYKLHPTTGQKLI